MGCTAIARKFAPYVQNLLSASEVRRIERHLAECIECKEKLQRIQSGHDYAESLRPVEPPKDLWPRIQNAIGKTAHPALHRRIALTSRIAAAAVVVIFSILAAWTIYQRNTSSAALHHLVPDKYRPIAISEIPNNQEPHISTVGYVTEIKMDDRDGDFKFKLVENLDDPSSFVICEVIPPMKVELPEVGHKVRVYGVSRFDPKETHLWYEVHPVMGIEKVN